jgi:hypothetical protein
MACSRIADRLLLWLRERYRGAPSSPSQFIALTAPSTRRLVRSEAGDFASPFLGAGGSAYRVYGLSALPDPIFRSGMHGDSLILGLRCLLMGMVHVWRFMGHGDFLVVPAGSGFLGSSALGLLVSY